MRDAIKKLRIRLQDPSLTVLLCVQILIIFVLPPIISADVGISSNWYLAAFIGFLLFVFVTSPSIWPTLVIVLALCLSAAVSIARQINETVQTDWLAALAAILVAATLGWLVARIVFSPGRMNEHRVRGAIVLYLNFAIVFANIYRLIEARAPGAFSNLPDASHHFRAAGELMYFSMSTLTTVGYGDIVPLNPIARSVANLEALVGQLYPAIILARVVTLYTSRDRN